MYEKNHEVAFHGLYSMKSKEQIRKQAAGITGVGQGEADNVWRDFRRVLDTFSWQKADWQEIACGLHLFSCNFFE